jgi:hypothetical protein
MPRIEMTPMVKLALYGLRIYLIVLLSLIGLKFVKTFTGVKNPAPPAKAESVEPVRQTTMALSDSHFGLG